MEHSDFQELVSAFRPDYHGPSRKALAGALPNEVTSEVELTAKYNLSGKAVNLIEDGWGNVPNDPVIAIYVHSEGKSHILQAVGCEAVTKMQIFLRK